MEKLKYFSIYDTKAKWYSKPFMSRNAAEAIRSFTDLVNSTYTPPDPVATHPEDYALFEIGQWDEIQGQLQPHKANINLVNAIQLKEANVQPLQDPSNNKGVPGIMLEANKIQNKINKEKMRRKK